MSKLSEDFNRYDKAQEKKIELLRQKELMEEQFKDNEVLKSYLKILKKIDKCNKEIEDGKTYLYEGMLDEEIDMLNGAVCDVSIKKPYIKSSIDTTKFLKDNQPGSKLYQKYVTQKSVKGNIIVKLVESK